jgi:hypothetical protein
MKTIVIIIIFGFAGLLAAAGTGALLSAETEREPMPVAPDHVVGVTITCTYSVRERAGPFGASTTRVITREGTGDYCTPDGPHRVGSISVTQVQNRRALVTVRTPSGGSYTVETTDLTVQVGDPWPR